MAQKSLVQQVAVKQDNGTMSSMTNIGATFDNVIDSRIGKGNYSLTQFFDAFMEYMQSADFVYYGATEPLNHHHRIWIDTGHSNQ